MNLSLRGVALLVPYAAVGLGLFAAGILSGMALYGLWPCLGVMLAALGLGPVSWPAFIAYFSLVNPWLEELYWRGWLGSPAPSLLARDVFFGGYHLLVLAAYIPWHWLAFLLLPLSAAGWFWRQIVRRDGSLRAPALFHFAADLSIMIAIHVHIARP